MAYSTVAIVAVLVHVIINRDVLFVRGGQGAAHGAYRNFLFGVAAFYVADALWGVLAEQGLVAFVHADTVVYFAIMAVTVFFWTRYVIAYLEQDDRFGTFLYYAGIVFLVFEIVVLVVNFFQPVLFWFDASGTYHAGVARYLTLGIQALMFLLASAYTLRAAASTEGALAQRYLTIGLFGAAMIVAIVVQVMFPLWPAYSMGYLLGTCVLHSYVVEGEKDEYRRRLEELFRLEQQQERELGSARRLAYTDSLTGVKSMHSYAEDVELLDQRIDSGQVAEFAVVVFDLNDLKLVNDTMGHEVGDEFIVASCRLICDVFEHSPVYRIGGDEFAAILEGRDYQDRFDLIAMFEQRVERNVGDSMVVIASGMAEFDPVHDNDYHAVFERADSKMYLRKLALKELVPNAETQA